MTTRPVPIDQINDAQLRRRIRSAEQQDGIIYGGAMFMNEQGTAEVCFVSVSFYPERKWWLYRDTQEDRIELTEELYQRVHRLQL